MLLLRLLLLLPRLPRLFIVVVDVCVTAAVPAAAFWLLLVVFREYSIVLLFTVLVCPACRPFRSTFRAGSWWRTYDMCCVASSTIDVSAPFVLLLLRCWCC